MSFWSRNFISKDAIKSGIPEHRKKKSLQKQINRKTKSSIPEIWKTGNPENRKTGKPEISK
jgi:hypothetical protein